jgi:hypothetical protein
MQWPRGALCTAMWQSGWIYKPVDCGGESYKPILLPHHQQ